MNKLLKTQSAPRIIAIGFALVIFIGSLLLMLPCSIQPGTHLDYIDALYTSASAVCVTGLTVVDAGDTFTALGQFFLAALIQIGWLRCHIHQCRRHSGHGQTRQPKRANAHS